MARDEFRCHWTHDHPRHKWLPILEEPDARVMYLDADNMVICPGKQSPLADHPIGLVFGT